MTSGCTQQFGKLFTAELCVRGSFTMASTPHLPHSSHPLKVLSTSWRYASLHTQPATLHAPSISSRNSVNWIAAKVLGRLPRYWYACTLAPALILLFDTRKASLTCSRPWQCSALRRVLLAQYALPSRRLTHIPSPCIHPAFLVDRGTGAGQVA